ncbi:MAG: hydrogenase formation protein HypD [Nitrospinota bacterium]|nr:hydrogenase formation protein HypD [Nitrospinota bacterium]
MKYVDEYRDKEAAEKQAEDIRRSAARLDGKVTFMEVCGTHTMAIYRYGIRSMIPDTIKLVSGPGCPVCVTPISYVDTAIEIAEIPDVLIATFGDMVRVPGSRSTLQKERGAGRDVRVVYSPLDAVAMARENPGREVVFLGVGFETTAPLIACSILEARREGLTNYSVLCAHKTMPEPMEALTSGEIRLDGYICPAHVSAIIGADAYIPVAKKFSMPCVVTGFEPLDILRGLGMLVRQAAEGRAEVENEYYRVVRPEGNLKAQLILEQVFVKTDALWRGLGTIPDSGLALSEEFEMYDASKRFGVSLPEARENPACICGQILKGLNDPPDCKLFGKACTPDNPIGACMVSSEGTCAAAYKYGESDPARA